MTGLPNSLHWQILKLRWWFFSSSVKRRVRTVWSGKWIRKFASVDRILNGLLHTKATVREKWMGALELKRLDEEQWKRVLKRLADPFPDETTSERILELASDHMTEQLIPPMAEVLGRLTQPDAKSKALGILTQLKTEHAVKAVYRFLALPHSEDLDITTALSPIARNYKEADAAGARLLAPLLANYSRYAHLKEQYSIFLMANWFAEKGFLNLAHTRYQTFVTGVLKHAEGIYEDVISKSPTGLVQYSEDQWNPMVDYVEQTMYILVRLLGFAKCRDALSLLTSLQSGVFHRRSTVAAIVAKYQITGQAAESDLEQIAASPEGRYLLWEQLEAIGELWLFPSAYRDQQLLAEAEMVEWICHPMEYGRAPKAIEFIETRAITSPGKDPRTIYAFRFIEETERGDRWVIGIAGPYCDFGPPTMGGRWTFSCGHEDTPENRKQAIDRLIREE